MTSGRSRRRPGPGGRSAAFVLAVLFCVTGCTSGTADPSTAAPQPLPAGASTASTASAESTVPTGTPGDASSGSGVVVPVTTTGPTVAGTTVTGTTVTTTTTASTRVSLVPQTPDGLVTGPGVDDTAITLGAIIDPETDRGFLTGFRLWQSGVNATTGICGRTVVLRLPPAATTPALTAYQGLAPLSLGLITLPSGADDGGLAEQIAADQVPAVTPSGQSTDLSSYGPMIVGATDDILAINAASYLAEAGIAPAGTTLSVVHDGSASAQDALTGLAWWAERADIGLDLHGPDALDGPFAPGVLVLGDPDLTGAVLAATPATATVITTLAGYDPYAIEPDQADRLLVGMPTTAPDSDHPGAVALTGLFTDAWGTPPGPLVFAGYATGTIWGRLLEQACADGRLTRAGIRSAAVAMGPDSPDSLLGAVDLAPLVAQGRPATKMSALSTADPAAAGGVTSLTWLRSAPGIADYPPD